MVEEYKVEITPDGKVILKKRLKFKCWKCGEVYSIFREFDLEQKERISCPFCNAKADVDFRSEKDNVVEVLKSQNVGGGVAVGRYKLPSVLPTSKLEE